MAAPILALSDGKPGHDSQTAGIVQAVEHLTGAPVERMQIRLRVKGLRPVLHAALAAAARLPAGGVGAARAAVAFGYRTDRRWPRYATAVVSAGGDTLYANALLALATGAPNLFSGSLRGVDPGHFRRIVTNRSAERPEAMPNSLVLEVAPMPKPPARPRPRPAGPYTVAVLVGGDGSGYRFGPGDWRALAARLGELDRSGARILLTTSRRTGAEGETILARAAAASNVERAVFFGRAPEKAMPEFLASADAFLVTPESASMVTEAVLAGRPVLLAGPRPARPQPRHERLLAQLVRDRRAARLEPDAPFPSRAELERAFRPIELHPVDQLAQALAPIWGRRL